MPVHLHWETYRKKETPELLEEGDSWIEGVPTKADRIAFTKGYIPKLWGSQEFPIDSGYQRVTLTRIEEKWHPKDGTGICAWLSHEDYSDNPDFEKRYRYHIMKEDLYLDLMDLIDPVPTLMKAKIIYDEKNCRQFFLE